MTNIAKIFTVAVTLVVGTGAIVGMALANTNPFYPDRLKSPNVSSPSPKVESGIPAPYRLSDLADEPSVSVPSPGEGNGIPAPYRIGN